MKIKCVVLCLMAALLFGGPLFGQAEESPADKVSFELEFNASLVSVDSDGVIDSMTDAGFNEGGTKIGLSYEDEFWGASAALSFGNEGLRFLSGEIGEMFGGPPLALDELYAWIKPFGEHFKFTGGIFENTDGLADYTDDIDDFAMGVFLPGEEAEGNPFFSEPEAIMTAPSLTDGFLTDLIFGPVTLQLLLAANFSKESASDLVSGLLSSIVQSPIPVDADARFFRIGGRVIIDAGVGTFSALFKTFQWPTAVEVATAGAFQVPPNSNLTGSKQNYHTFGGYFDLTAVENLGVSLGYTGFITAHDGEDVDNILYSGIDLRATWTGIEGLSLSTHNNVSFAKGSEKDWFLLRGKDASFFNLYNAIGATKELTEVFSVNAVVSNVYSKTALDADNNLEQNTIGASATFIAKVSENAEFNIGVALDVTKASQTGADDETATVFSVPVGIKVNF